MITTQSSLISDTWVKGTWERYLQILNDPAYATSKGYYFHPYLRIEMLPVGFDHSKDHVLMGMIISLYAILKNIRLNMLDNCTFRKAALRDCQPDLACYIGNQVNSIPNGTNIVNLDVYAAPDLVVEIGKTTIFDDQTVKRVLYEQIPVREYWVVDVQQSRVSAWQIIEGGSIAIEISNILSGLPISLVETTLLRSRDTDQSELGNWFIKKIMS